VHWKARVPVLAAALWWGSLSTVGFLVVPMLFSHLVRPAQAGQMAALLFSAGTWVSVACGVLLLIAARTEQDPPSLEWREGALAYVVFGMLLALLSEFAVAPRIVARQNLAVWHAVGTAVYAAQWLCALVVMWKLAGEAGHPGAGRDPDT
jgi:hypothetical protein